MAWGEAVLMTVLRPTHQARAPMAVITIRENSQHKTGSIQLVSQNASRISAPLATLAPKVNGATRKMLLKCLPRISADTASSAV